MSDRSPGAPTLAVPSPSAPPQLLEQFPYGLAVVESDGRIVYMNRKARQLLMPVDAGEAGSAWTCCDLICSRLSPVVGAGCIVGRIGAGGGVLPEVRMDIDQERLQAAAWVTASSLDSRSRP